MGEILAAVINKRQNHRPAAKVILESYRSSCLVAKFHVQWNLRAQFLFQIDISQSDGAVIVGKQRRCPEEAEDKKREQRKFHSGW